MAKTKNLSEINLENVLEFCKEVPRDEIRVITALGQHLDVNSVDFLITKNWDILQKYIAQFPELKVLNYYLIKRHELLQNGNTFIRYFSYHSVGPELSEIHKNIMKS